ncbi:DUF2790 domain-containing protein [Pseudomonas aeruginosa]|nr:DUF2790 domain-containing protein [Pseudomonas aeruginosa]
MNRAKLYLCCVALRWCRHRRCGDWTTTSTAAADRGQVPSVDEAPSAIPARWCATLVLLTSRRAPVLHCLKQARACSDE